MKKWSAGVFAPHPGNRVKETIVTEYLNKKNEYIKKDFKVENSVRGLILRS